MGYGGETKRKIDVGVIAWSSAIGIACGLTYELTECLLQFAWDGIEMHSGPVLQVRFLQAFIFGLLMVALAGFLPAIIFRISNHELMIAPVAGAVSGIFTGATLVLFDYMQHFNYYADRPFSLAFAGYALQAIVISPQFFLLITVACAIIASVSALLYMNLDLEIG